MIELTLMRGLSDVRGTIGILYFGDEHCFSLEDPWKRNEPNVSCIPAGWYDLERDTFKDKYENFRVVNPPPRRSAIEIHKGNTRDDTQGCILLGEALSLTPVNFLLQRSSAGFGRFMEFMEGRDEALLIIKGDQL